MYRQGLCKLGLLRRGHPEKVFVNHSKNCLILQSDNSSYPDQELPIDERENLVIGQAIGCCSGCELARYHEFLDDIYIRIIIRLCKTVRLLSLRSLR